LLPALYNRGRSKVAPNFLAQVREIEATGGLALEDFIAELEAATARAGGLFEIA